MMIATLRWRDEFKVDEAISEQFDAKIFGNMGHVYGKDKEGRPVTYVFLVTGTVSLLTFTLRWNPDTTYTEVNRT